MDNYPRTQIPIDAYAFLSYSSLKFRDPLLIISGVFYLSLLSGHYFSNLGKASTAIQELTLPISTAEKLVCSFLLSTVLTMLTFVIVFLIVDTSIISILREIYRDVNVDLPVQSQHYGFENRAGFKFFHQTFGSKELTVFSLFALYLSGVFTLGSVYFSRLSFIKTSFAVLLFVGILALSVSSAQRIMTQGRIQTGGMEGVMDFFLVVIIAIIGSLWVAIYFRLKEKEV